MKKKYSISTTIICPSAIEAAAYTGLAQVIIVVRILRITRRSFLYVNNVRTCDLKQFRLKEAQRRDETLVSNLKNINLDIIYIYPPSVCLLEYRIT